MSVNQGYRRMEDKSKMEEGSEKHAGLIMEYVNESLALSFKRY